MICQMVLILLMKQLNKEANTTHFTMHSETTDDECQKKFDYI